MTSTRIRVGDRLPDATFHSMTPDGPKPVTTDEFFGSRKVVLFAVPGAFTPTCSKSHVPSFLEVSDAARAKGVDAIACVAVNDAFVLDAWGKDLGAGDRIAFLADGNGDFAGKIGMSLDATGLGLGHRSHRYAMVVEDGTVRALEVEENPGVCTVSSGSSILDAL